MNESLFQSLDEIKEALKHKHYDAEIIMMGSIVFMGGAVRQRDQAVKQFLLDFVNLPATTLEERSAKRYAISWLSDYKDPALLPMFVRLLSNTRGMCQEQTIIALVKLDDLRAAGAIATLLEEDNSPRDLDFLLNALAATGAAEYIDLIASYLSHESVIVRIGAITGLLLLGAKAGRKEVLDIVMPYLSDPSRDIRIKTAYHINMRFPDEFYDRGLEGYLPEGLHFPRPQTDSSDSPEPAREVARGRRQMAVAAAAD